MASRLGYLFERFPAFTQTFCAREIAELYQQGFSPPVFSIRRPREPYPLNISLQQIPIRYLPDTNSLRFKLKTKLISPRWKRLWAGSGDTRDKGRFREAAYLGPKMQKAGISHLHVHFAGLACRTAWWLKRLFGISYSFTGHANDIFCPKPDQRVTLEQLVADAVFVVTASDYSAQFLRCKFPPAREKIFRVYNGLDLSFFRPATPPRDCVQILAIGRLIEKKGFASLVAACALLRASGIRFQCSIAGEGPQREPLAHLIRTNCLGDQVHLLGPKSQTDIVRLLAQATIFAFPAIHDQAGDSDNLPTVLIEALASSLPIVATRIAGIPEIVQHERNGLLVEERNPAQLAEAIAMLCANPGLLAAYGKASRAIAEQRFRLQDTVAELKMLFHDLVPES